jgi:hypothetical protein
MAFTKEFFFLKQENWYHYIKRKNGKRSHTKAHQHTPLGFIKGIP